MGAEPISSRLAPPPCNGAPPSGLRRPYVRRLCIERATWTRAIRGCIPDTTHLAVAHTIASYGNTDGTNAHPGGERLAEDVCRSVRTVRTSLAWLDEHGFVTRTAIGNRTAPRGWADTYRLTLPSPLALSLGLWGDVDGSALWMERPRETQDGLPIPVREALTKCNPLHVVA